MNAAMSTISWNKVIALSSAFGIPLISVLCWLLISGTQLVDDVHNIAKKQTITEARLDQFGTKLDKVNDRIDTLSLRIHDQQFIMHYYTEKYINGKLVLVPVK